MSGRNLASVASRVFSEGSYPLRIHSHNLVIALRPPIKMHRYQALGEIIVDNLSQTPFVHCVFSIYVQLDNFKRSAIQAFFLLRFITLVKTFASHFLNIV